VVLQLTTPALQTRITTPLSNVNVHTKMAPFAISLNCKFLLNAILVLTLVSGIFNVNMLIIEKIIVLSFFTFSYYSELSVQK